MRHIETSQCNYGLAIIHVVQCSSSIFTLEVTLLVLAGGARRSRNHLAYVVMSDLTARGAVALPVWPTASGAVPQSVSWSTATHSGPPRRVRAGVYESDKEGGSAL